MTEKLLARDFFERGHIPLCVFRMPYVDFGRDLHSHNFHELMIVIGGMAEHRFEGRTCTLSMGDVFLIPPGYTHGYEVSLNSGIQVLNVLFNLERLHIQMWDLDKLPGYHALFSVNRSRRYEPHLRLSARDLAFVNAVVEEIEAEQEEMAPGHEFLCDAKFRELMVFLIRRYSHVAAASGKHLLKLGELVDHMERHLDENLRVGELAGIAGMSVSTLRRNFRDSFGCSPMNYLQQLRVKKAMLLLADPMKSIGEVAFNVGFNDSGYFSRVFREVTGETPRDFRNRLGDR